MKRLLFLITFSLYGAQSKPIEIPKRKVKIYDLPKEMGVDERLLMVPSPVFKLDDATPPNTPEAHQLNWEVLIEGKLMRIKLSIEKAEKKDK
jgi:hypothetical protein